ncbi:MAG TPA: SH3 domain-containing protein [Methyloceanibacter sp.]|nr:SH3 domain-containing protein [Methyloceanibacter sp.]
MLVRCLTGIAVALSLALAVPAAAAEDGAKQATAAKGSQSGLRVPRFVSLKSNRVNVRRGPSTEQAIDWVFARAGLPVEIIAEADNWRRVRDSEGADGWVYHSLLSGRRTVLISPWSKGKEAVTLYRRRSTGSRAVAQLQSGVLGNILSCDGEWCELTVDDYSGYVEQSRLWGVYRGEEINN